MDSVTHGSISVLIGIIFIQFYSGIPLFLLIATMFVFGVLVDYDHEIYYRKRFKNVQLWNIPQLIKIYFETVDENDDFIYHSWLHEPFGVIVVSIGSYLLFSVTNFYPPLTILAISCYSAHFLVDLFSGKMKPLAPFNENFVINWSILPRNSLTGTGISFITFVISLGIQLSVG